MATPTEPIRLGDYRRMIAQLTWRAYWKLSPQTRGWISFDDLHQDSQMFVYTHLLPKYKRSRGQFGTVLHHTLANHLYSVVASHYSWKRADHLSVSLAHPDGQERTNFSTHAPRSLPSSSRATNFPQHYVHTKILLERVLTACPDELGAEIVAWFAHPKRKVQKGGRRFLAVSAAFRRRAESAGLTFQDLSALAKQNAIGPTLLSIHSALK